MPQPAVAEIADLPLSQALEQIRARFDVDAILDRTFLLEDVAEYYRQSDRGYKLFHSREGALHIALGCDGHQDTSCFARQADLFAEQMRAIGAARVVEFGCGMGYNVRRIASTCPELEVLGVDLTESHVATAGKACKGLLNASFQVANYESLDLPERSFHGVLAVETLCQTDSQENAVREAARVLAPGGRLVAIDCWRTNGFDGCDNNLQLAARLVEKTTAVNVFPVVDRWAAMGERLGLRLVERIDHSAETRQNLARLYRLARRYFKLPRAAGALARVFPPMLVQNAVCGLLMPYSVGFGAHEYCTVVLEKPRDP